MKYACLVYLTETEINSLSQSDWDAFNRECMAFGDVRVANVERLGGEALQPTHTATTVRVRNGRLATTDGPFAETKEQLAGFYAIEAENLDDAIAFASQIPPARYGTIEIRPLRALVAEGNAR
jgi:hypothetical protein